MPYFLGNVLRVCTDILASVFEAIYMCIGAGSKKLLCCLGFVVQYDYVFGDDFLKIFFTNYGCLFRSDFTSF